MAMKNMLFICSNSKKDIDPRILDEIKKYFFSQYYVSKKNIDTLHTMFSKLNTSNNVVLLLDYLENRDRDRTLKICSEYQKNLKLHNAYMYYVLANELKTDKSIRNLCDNLNRAIKIYRRYSC